jgi:hypothetical protein
MQYRCGCVGFLERPMSTEISDYASVRERVASLGLEYPIGIVLLPDNFDIANSKEEFRQRPEATALRKVLEQAKVPVGQLVANSRPAYVVNRSSEWIAPLLFVSASLLTTNPTAVSVALGVLSNYITDFLKSFPGPKRVKFEIVVERKGDRVCKRISYEGEASGITSLSAVVKEVGDE